MENFVYENKTKFFFGKGVVKVRLKGALRPYGKTVLLTYVDGSIKRSGFKNARLLLKDPNNHEARSELAWARSLVGNGLLKMGKVTDFQRHMLEHQIDAYTNCNHGEGLAVLRPVLYRHIFKRDLRRFSRFATKVFGIASTGNDEETAALGIDALASYIKEIGLSTNFREFDISPKTDLRAIANSTILTRGCCKKLSYNELYQILKECE